MTKILVTGSKGMLGRDLCPALEDEGYETVETDVDNFDITDYEGCLNFANASKPDLIIHLAAYTNVDKAEEEKELAEKINAKGTENVAKICAKLDVPMVYISTDYVFDGEKKGEYLPYDAINPINVYGKTKAEGEKAVRENLSKFYIVRTSWLYGHHGANFVEKMLSLADKKEIKVVDDQIGCPSSTVDVSSAIVTLLKEEAPYGIYHACGKGKISRYEFAKEIFKLAEVNVTVKPCKSSEFPTPAKRPSNSAMFNDNLCGSWKKALKDYIDLREDD